MPSIRLLTSSSIRPVDDTTEPKYASSPTDSICSPPSLNDVILLSLRDT